MEGNCQHLAKLHTHSPSESAIPDLLSIRLLILYLFNSAIPLLGVYFEEMLLTIRKQKKQTKNSKHRHKVIHCKKMKTPQMLTHIGLAE